MVPMRLSSVILVMSSVSAGLLGVALAGCGAAAVQTAPDLPISKVVLYQNGVGYFERRGTVKGEAVELRVRPDQINDVLKSLSVLDLSGGVPSSVSLPVERSGDSLAAELPPQVRNATGMTALLPVLRGAQIEVETADGTFAGRVVGVEMSNRPNDKGEQQPTAMLTLMDGEDELVTTPVAGVQRVTIGDRTLSVGLQQSLEISRSDGAWKPVTLTIRLAGDSSHDLIVSYIHEVPIWRPAYRAWVESGKGVQLQGWAIVDNVSGEPWTDVNLTLVVGSPLSFRYDLHTPHHVTRPDLTSRLPTTADAPPEPDVGYEMAPPSPPPMAEASGAYDDMKEEAPSAAYRSKKSGAPSPPRSMPKPSAGPSYDRQQVAEESKKRDAMIRSAQALVTGKEVGALYTYEATTPITVPDRSAALVNIVSRKVDGQDVFLFREPTSGAAPFRAVLLRNGKDSALEGGPITLYVDGTFAGEGFIGRVGKDETAFIPYAREGGFAVNIQTESRTDELRLVKVVDGRITIQGKRVYTRTVAIDSNRDQESVAYVKLGLTGGMTMQDPPKDIVKSGGEIYLPVRIKAKSKGEAKLVESTPVEFVEAGLTPTVVTAFRYFLQNAKPEDAIAGPVRELMAIYDEVARIQADSQSLREQREILEREAQRIQSNLDALPDAVVAAALRKQLLTQLEGVSKKAADVAKRLVENEVKLAALQEKTVVLLRQIELK